MVASTPEQRWVITYEGLADPIAMQRGLEASLFYRRLAGPKEVTVSLQQVVFTFGAPKDRNDVMKLCTQQFQKYSTYASRTIVNVTGSGATVTTPSQAASSSSTDVTPPPAPPSTTLAVTNRVEDIKRIAGGLIASESHALLLFFGLHYAAQRVAPSLDSNTKMLAAKNAAASAFAQPVGDWHRLLDEWFAKVLPPSSAERRCNCRCRTRSNLNAVHICAICKAI